MAKKTNLGSTKRFGARYGRRNKDKVAFLEKGHREKQKCPFCNYLKVKRLSKGIWECNKCNAKFAGKAYTFEVSKKKEATQSRIDAIGELPEEPVKTEEELLEETVEEEPQEKVKQDDSDIPEELRSEADIAETEDDSKEAEV